jgi:hypothetical protein
MVIRGQEDKSMRRRKPGGQRSEIEKVIWIHRGVSGTGRPVKERLRPNNKFEGGVAGLHFKSQHEGGYRRGAVGGESFQEL